LDDAEARFCSIATTDDQTRTTFYVDDRYFRIKDLAWLGLGRVAHEGRRASDAFYYYFQVPSDSERVAEALFEAAYSMYEGDDFDTSIDLLDQLETRFPASPFVDEAQLLRGYVHLGRCEFEEASQLFVGYQERFAPLLTEIDAILASPTRQARLYDDLVRGEDRTAPGEALDTDEETTSARSRLDTPAGMLMALLRVDPAFYSLHAQRRVLDAEAARAGRLSADLRGLSARIRSEAPAAAAAAEAFESEAVELRRMIATGRDGLEGLSRQLDALRRGGAPAAELEGIERTLRQHADTLREAVRRLRVAERAFGEEGAADPEGEGVLGLLARDARRARRLPSEVRAMRARLTEAASGVAVNSLRGLRRRLSGSLRRARIGRIDAVMGRKRRVEVQIESLAAGRFPPELVDPLRIQGLLRDDEEYWPFEGELWTDEFNEGDALEGEDGGDGGGDDSDAVDAAEDTDE
ncbi:MAG: hypothetical protein AAF411_06015, partial [Myxococcota bacterium]